VFYHYEYLFFPSALAFALSDSPRIAETEVVRGFSICNWTDSDFLACFFCSALILWLTWFGRSGRGMESGRRRWWGGGSGLRKCNHRNPPGGRPGEGRCSGRGGDLYIYTYI